MLTYRPRLPRRLVSSPKLRSAPLFPVTLNGLCVLMPVFSLFHFFQPSRVTAAPPLRLHFSSCLPCFQFLSSDFIFASGCKCISKYMRVTMFPCVCARVRACPLMRIFPGTAVASGDEQALEVKAGKPLLLHAGWDGAASGGGSEPSQARTHCQKPKLGPVRAWGTSSGGPSWAEGAL